MTAMLLLLDLLDCVLFTYLVDDRLGAYCLKTIRGTYRRGR